MIFFFYVSLNKLTFLLKRPSNRDFVFTKRIPRHNKTFKRFRVLLVLNLFFVKSFNVNMFELLDCLSPLSFWPEFDILSRIIYTKVFLLFSFSSEDNRLLVLLQSCCESMLCIISCAYRNYLKNMPAKPSCNKVKKRKLCLVFSQWMTFSCKYANKHVTKSCYSDARSFRAIS